MDSILTKLYYGQIDIANQKIQVKELSHEKELYQELYKTLSPEHFDLFERFLSAYADNHSVYPEKAFRAGVKLGFELCKELNNTEI